ncbi:tagaturonate reductase [Paenibacillus sp. J5C_2022]|uniref:tagaturonate reductase n=1 Tax=Paenibacillus sp. J5C2022 TaxID=2977129 RepID=UPI0021D06649|nr:tagaturonate reductase [Paenibacillus sp. J5C2022]MCU6712537.1 tagaturonate reductase [Paenibacillus sp. J5C2022]
MDAQTINRNIWHTGEQGDAGPVTILQIGEGNFLRGFFDWMIEQCRKQGLYDGSIAVTQPRPGGKPKIDALAAQDGLYTLVLRGLEEGNPVERREVISAISEAFDPYSEWDRFLSLAERPELKVVVSNTTEAGLAYRPEPYTEGQPIHSYPGKLTVLLYRRYLHFGGSPDAGLVCLPCELLERNGDTLRQCVLQYCEDWELPESFKQWVKEHNRFLNSLVDRIVTGYPEQELTERWFGEWGYRDPMLTTAEPYHFWAIEGELELERLLPLRKAGLNVHWVDDLKPFQLRKVRILNGSHTLMTPLGIVLGLETVREAMEHPQVGRLVKLAVEHEIIPALPELDAAELRQYAQDVYGRFLNPFIRHRLSDIAMNSLSKFKVRLLPSLQYAMRHSDLPAGLVAGMAGLLRYYKVSKGDNGFVGEALNGSRYTVRDDEELLELIAGIWSVAERQAQPLQETVAQLLSREELWGCNLNALASGNRLAAALSSQLDVWEGLPHV